MEAFKCDRCGKLYELTSKQTKMRESGVNYGIHNSLNGYYLDLCDKCFNELQEWMAVYEEAESEDKVMSYGDIYDEFCEKFPNSHAEDYRPACSLHIPQLMKDIPNGIVVWLKDGSKIVYIAESEDEDD